MKNSDASLIGASVPVKFWFFDPLGKLERSIAFSEADLKL
jgi:hypothetical protein